jgi:hypothetical protein
MTPFEAYKLYLAVKQHFTAPSYDYFKYNGKVKANLESFESRKDKYMFYKLSKKENLLDYLVANLSEDPNIWVGDLVNQDSELVYKKYMSRKESLTYIFKNDIDNLLEDFDQNFKVENGDYPPLLKLLIRKKINKETFIIINDCVSFFASWNKNIIDPVLWPTISMNCKKLYPFMNFEKEKYCRLLRDRYSISS